MRIVGWSVALLVASLGVVMGLSMVASESGEVVVLHTRDESGSLHETRVWIVDEAGQPWLRAGNPQSSWLVAIQRDPGVSIERAGASASYTAVPDASSRDRINALFAAKYGWADAYIGALFGREDATPIRLQP